MEISREYAKVMFNKGMIIWVYDDADHEHSFHDREKTKPVPTLWCKNKAMSAVQVDTWEDIIAHYRLHNEGITAFHITTSGGHHVGYGR